MLGAGQVWDRDRMPGWKPGSRSVLGSRSLAGSSIATIAVILITLSATRTRVNSKLRTTYMYYVQMGNEEVIQLSEACAMIRCSSTYWQFTLTYTTYSKY